MTEVKLGDSSEYRDLEKHQSQRGKPSFKILTTRRVVEEVLKCIGQWSDGRKYYKAISFVL